MADEVDFWRDVAAVARAEIESILSNSIGVRPGVYAGQTLDRYGRTTYAEYRRGVDVEFGTTLALALPASGSTMSGTLIAGTADINYNDGSAFWSTANPSRFTAPVGGRYYVGAYVQISGTPGTASMRARIVVSNNNDNTYLIAAGARVAGPAATAQSLIASFGRVVPLRAGGYVEIVIDGNAQAGSVDASISSCNFVMERVG